MRLKTLILFILLLLAWWTRAYAQEGNHPEPEPLVLSGDRSEYPLGLYLELLEDPSGELTIEDVTSPEYAAQFVPSQVEVPNLGGTYSTYWVRLRLRSENPVAERWLLESSFASLHFVDLYSPLADGDGFAVKQTGAMRPLSSRDIYHPNIVFDLTIPGQSQQTYYLRIKTGDSMTLPFTLWAPDTFFVNSLRDQAVHGIFLGIMVSMLIYNLFLLFSLRDESYLYLVLLLAGMTLYDLSHSSFLEVYIAPDLYQLKQHTIVFSIGFIFMPLILFNESFLSVKTLFPKMHWVNVALLVIWVVLTLSTFFVTYNDLVMVIPPTAVVTMVINMVIVLMAWRRGLQTARFLVLAWSVLIAGLLGFVLVRMGIMPSNALTENGYRLGFSWMAICWSLALADRINLLRAEMESANRELQDSEDRLSQTLEAMPVGVVVYGSDQTPTFINRRTAEILSNLDKEIQPDISKGRTLDAAADYFSFRVVGSDQAYPLEKMPVYRALQGESSSVDDVEADLVDWRVPLEIWASPVFDNAGNVESAVVAFQDISGRKEQEAELERYRHHLEQLVVERTEELSVINEQLTDEMVERAVLEGLLHKRIQWMSTLALARQGIKGSADLPAVYEELSKEIQQLMDAGSLFLIRWQDGGEQVEFLCQPMVQGPEPDSENIITSFEDDTTLRQDLEPGEIVVFSADEVSSMEEPIRVCFSGSGMQTLILAPMIGGESVSGALGLALSLPKRELTEAQKELINKITLDLDRLAQDARYLDQSRVLVASEERNRLARDLHDSVTQVLFSASLVAEVLPKIWRRDHDQGLQSLEELRRLTRGALAEMRTMLLELRPAAVAKSPLSELLAQLTEASTSRVQLPFKLFIEQTQPLPKDVHATFYRIAQEALNNVAKHARASQVTLSYRAMPLSPKQSAEKMVGVRLVIEDDGDGFSPGDEQVEHMGLGIMRERAADVGAELEIESRIGEGTRVTLDWCGVVEEVENES